MCYNLWYNEPTMFPAGSLEAEELHFQAHLAQVVLSERTALQFFLSLCTGRPLTDSDDTRFCINTI